MIFLKVERMNLKNEIRQHFENIKSMKIVANYLNII